jgi:uncharacterized membrane protein
MSHAPDPVATRIRDTTTTVDPTSSVPSVAPARAWTGPLLTTLSLLALAVAGYLTWVKLAGVVPVCAVLSGCETVENSSYSEFLGVPVAAFGMLGAGAMLAGGLLWWRRADRRGLMVAYAIGLASLPVLAYLTFLELAVIRAVCVWCVVYALLVVGAWIVAMAGLRGTTSEGSP